MATLEERLNRREWDPSTGDELIGVIVDIDESSFQRDDGTTYWYPVLVVRANDDAEWEVRCTRGGLFNPVVAKQPAVKDRIGIRYDGTVDTSYGEAHRYRVAFDEPDEPKRLDWSRMTSQEKGRGNAGDGSADTSSTVSAATDWPDAPPPAPEPEPDDVF